MALRHFFILVKKIQIHEQVEFLCTLYKVFEDPVVTKVYVITPERQKQMNYCSLDMYSDIYLYVYNMNVTNKSSSSCHIGFLRWTD